MYMPRPVWHKLRHLARKYEYAWRCHWGDRQNAHPDLVRPSCNRIRANAVTDRLRLIALGRATARRQPWPMGSDNVNASYMNTGFDKNKTS